MKRSIERNPLFKLLQFSALQLSFMLCSCSYQEHNNIFYPMICHEFELAKRGAQDSVRHEMRAKALEYLSESVKFHSGVPRHLCDSTRTEVLDLRYNDFPSDTAMWIWLVKNKYYIDERSAEPDEIVLNDTLIIDNLNLAFDAWDMPWSRSIPFEDFCRYILPYRVADEELTNWRSNMMSSYMPLVEDCIPHLC